MINEGIQYSEDYDYNNARILFDKALEIDPNHPNALNNKNLLLGI